MTQRSGMAPGPVVLVTGASSGIGLAVARRLAGRAQRLFVTGRDGARLAAVAGELRAVPVAADLAVAGEAERIAGSVQAESGRLDWLINCAGQLEVGPAETLGAEVAERLMRVNFLGAVALIHACLPLLRRGRRPLIINVSSLAGAIAPPYMAAYAASKHALNGYSHALRQELRPEGIHVGLVLPGPTATPMVSGRLGGPHYRLPPGVPTLTADRVAGAIVAAAERRLPHLVVPGALRAGIRLGAAFPGLVDLVYARHLLRKEG